jgi:chromosome segregation ATPase
MPRKKMTHSKMDKSSIPVSKNSKKKVDLSQQTQSLEKDFKEISLQLANQFRNDLALLKEKEKTLTATVAKLNSQYKAAKKNYSTLSKAKNKTSLAAKKQLKELKKNAVQLTKTIKTLEVELAKVKIHKKTLSIKQANFATLSKQIAKFDKTSKAKPAKKAKLLKKTQKKTVKASKKAVLSKQQQTIQPLIQDANQPAYTLEAPVDSQLETEEVK